MWFVFALTFKCDHAPPRAVKAPENSRKRQSWLLCREPRVLGSLVSAPLPASVPLGPCTRSSPLPAASVPGPLPHPHGECQLSTHGSA